MWECAESGRVVVVLFGDFHACSVLEVVSKERVRLAGEHAGDSRG